MKAVCLAILGLFFGSAMALAPTKAGFFSRSDLSSPALPNGGFAGDFNGDAFPDLAVSVECQSGICPQGATDIFLGNGDGTLRAGAIYLTGVVGTASVAGGDFNGDGNQDLAVSSTNCDTQPCPLGKVSVLLGSGDGTFTSAVNYDTGEEPFFITTADINGDGILDVVTANNCGYNCPATRNAVSVLLGNGNGTFTPHIDTQLANSNYALWVAIGDLNGDGLPDLVTADYCVSQCFSGPAPLSILFGTGNGTFTAGPELITSGGVSSTVIGDFNSDGIPDIAAGDYSGLVAVFLGSGGATFQPPSNYTVGKSPWTVTTGDFNNDGRLDLATSNFGNLNLYSGSVSVLIGKGDGSFLVHSDSPSGTAPVSIATADFNRDGKLDLATVNKNDGTVSILLQTSVTLSRAKLAFPTTLVGTLSQPRTVSLENIGSVTLHIAGLALGGANPGDFKFQSGCGATLAPHRSCSIAVSFMPTVKGQRSATLTISDDSAGGQQTIPLLGSGAS